MHRRPRSALEGQGAGRPAGTSRLAALFGVLMAAGAACILLADRQLRSCGGTAVDSRSQRMAMAGQGASCPDEWEDYPINVTIFCAPKPFEPGGGGRQRQALLSWLSLQPPPQVVIFGDSSFDEVAAQFPGRVTVDSDVDFNFRGMAMFHSMVARARTARSQVSVLINGDIILLSDFLPALRKAHTRFPSFLLTAMRWDVTEFPFRVDEQSGGMVEAAGGAAARGEDVVRFVKGRGSLHTYGGVDFWAWNNGPVPFHEPPMPPFVYGRGRYDNWLLHEAVVSNLRAVIDASDAITSVHINHSYAHLDSKESAAGGGMLEAATGGNFWTVNKKRSWEAFANVYASRTAGTFSSQMGTALHMPWKLAGCEEPRAGNLCFARRRKPASCRCEYSPFVTHTQSEPKMVGRQILCGTVVIDNDFYLEALPSGAAPLPGLPHTLEQLLPQVGGANKTVIMGAASSRYRELAADFACRMGALGLRNVVLVALDEDCYRYLFTQGLAVYYEPGPVPRKGSLTYQELMADCALGMPCFTHYRQVKWYTMSKVLAAGYTVLWSDLDMVWLRDPFLYMENYYFDNILVQSAVFDLRAPASSAPPPGADSGAIIYVRPEAKSRELIEAALQESIKRRKAGSGDADGHPFHALACGLAGEKGRAGGGQRAAAASDDECTFRNGLSVLFLHRDEFPSGHEGSIWRAKDVRAECQKRGCYSLHNNAIRGGAAAKVERLRRTGLLKFDSVGRMCIRNWTATASDPF